MQKWYTSAISDAEEELRKVFEHCHCLIEVISKDQVFLQFKVQITNHPAEIYTVIINKHHEEAASILLYKSEYVRGWHHNLNTVTDPQKLDFKNEELREFAKDLRGIVRYNLHSSNVGRWVLVLCHTEKPIRSFYYSNQDNAKEDIKLLKQLQPLLSDSDTNNT